MKTMRLFGLALIAGFLFTACDKKEEASPVTVDLMKKATLKVYVYADLNHSTIGYENAPAGTKLILTASYNDLINGTTKALSTGREWRDTIVLDGSGSFTVEVPTRDGGVSVTITPVDFEAAQTQNFNDYETSINKIFSATAVSVTVVPEDNKIEEITYTGAGYDNAVEMCTISGVFTYIQNDSVTCVTGDEVTKENLSLTFWGSGKGGWSKTTTTGTGGLYTITLPADEQIYVSYTFEGTKKSGTCGGPYSTNVFVYENEALAVGTGAGFSGSNEDVDITAGGGTVKPVK